MGREHRRDFEFAYHHVMNRTSAKRFVFEKERHRQTFFEVLEHVVKVDEIEVHAYCLMGNHFHLLMRTPRANLAQAMQRLGSMFTKRFNRLEQLDGPLFRARYKSRIVGHDSYLRQLCRYIHRNPVAAGLVKRPGDYAWSSYRAYALSERRPSWLSVTELPTFFPGPDPVTNMCKFIEDDEQTGEDHLNFEKMLRGSAEECDIIPRRCIDISKQQKNLPVVPANLDNIIKYVSKSYDVAKESLFICKPGAKNQARDVAITLVRQEACMATRDIAIAFSISRTSVSSALSRIRKHLRYNINLEDDFRRLSAEIRCNQLKTCFPCDD